MPSTFITTSTFVEYKLRLAEHHTFYYAMTAKYLSSIPTTTYILTALTLCSPIILFVIIHELEESRLRKESPGGCRKLGMNINSNLSNEFDKKFSEGRPPSTEETSAEWWRLKSMWIYPVKGCKGIELSRGTVVADGMEYDRQFVFAQPRKCSPTFGDVQEVKAPHTWSLITQRDYPLLAQVSTEIWVAEHSSSTCSPEKSESRSEGFLVLSYPFQAGGWSGLVAKWSATILGRVPNKRFSIPFNATSAKIEKSYNFREVEIGCEKVHALNMEVDLPEDLRIFLGISSKLELCKVDDFNLRKEPCHNLTGSPSNQRPTAFQNSKPIHLINLASVRDLESRIPYAKGTNRLSARAFGANLIITGPEAYTEDTWKRIKIGWYEYEVSAPILRGKFTDTNQSKDERHLGESNGSPRSVDMGAGTYARCLGMSLHPVARESALRVGDEIVVLEHGEHGKLNYL